MLTIDPGPAIDINVANVTRAVRLALQWPSLEIDDLHWTPLPGHISNPATGGLYRVHGCARDTARRVDWSLILKVVHLSLDAPHDWGADLVHFGYWKRETLAYKSTVLDNLGSDLKAPRCFDVAEQADGSVWLWLEEVKESGDALWPISRYGLAARHFGQWQGSYLAGRPMPAEPWLKRGWLRSWVEHFELLMNYVDRPHVWENPLVRAAFPVPVMGRILALWAQRHRWMGLLDRLPQTVCHFDMWRPNLLARRNSHGCEETVALDWQCVGLGPAGEAGNLLVTSLMNLEFDPGTAKALDRAIWDGYMAGLGESGWIGDPRAVRFCYTAYPALRWGLVFPMMMILPAVLDPERRAEAQAKYGKPIEQLLKEWAAALYFLLDLADEARLLADGLPAEPPSGNEGAARL